MGEPDDSLQDTSQMTPIPRLDLHGVQEGGKDLSSRRSSTEGAQGGGKDLPSRRDESPHSPMSSRHSLRSAQSLKSPESLPSPDGSMASEGEPSQGEESVPAPRMLQSQTGPQFRILPGEYPG